MHRAIIFLALFLLVFPASVHADVPLSLPVAPSQPLKQSAASVRAAKSKYYEEMALAAQKQRDDEFKKNLPAIKAKEKAMMDAEAAAEKKRVKSLLSNGH